MTLQEIKSHQLSSSFKSLQVPLYSSDMCGAMMRRPEPSSHSHMKQTEMSDFHRPSAFHDLFSLHPLLLLFLLQLHQLFIWKCAAPNSLNCSGCKRKKAKAQSYIYLCPFSGASVKSSWSYQRSLLPLCLCIICSTYTHTVCAVRVCTQSRSDNVNKSLGHLLLIAGVTSIKSLDFFSPTHLTAFASLFFSSFLSHFSFPPPSDCLTHSFLFLLPLLIYQNPDSVLLNLQSSLSTSLSLCFSNDSESIAPVSRFDQRGMLWFAL